jgi:hypothetical protein
MYCFISYKSIQEWKIKTLLSGLNPLLTNWQNTPYTLQTTLETDMVQYFIQSIYKQKYISYGIILIQNYCDWAISRKQIGKHIPKHQE